MPATLAQIKGWLSKAQSEGATHMLVRCDSFDYRGSPGDSCCYPVSVMPGEDVREKVDSGGDRLMEVYSLTGKHSIESQLRETRARHYD